MDNVKDMTDEQLIQEYVARQEKANELKMEQELLKDELKERMVESGQDRIYCDYGGATYSSHTRNQFSQKRAKEFLTEEQIDECTDEKEVTRMAIMSPEAMQKQKDFLQMRE